MQLLILPAWPATLMILCGWVVRVWCLKLAIFQNRGNILWQWFKLDVLRAFWKRLYGHFSNISKRILHWLFGNIWNRGLWISWQYFNEQTLIYCQKKINLLSIFLINCGHLSKCSFWTKTVLMERIWLICIYSYPSITNNLLIDSLLLLHLSLSLSPS